MLILLIGPKGSGKSHIGRLLESACEVHFFHVEPHWMKYHEECATAGSTVSITEGIERVHPAIADALEAYQHVCVETTGASSEILEDLLSFGESVPILLAKIEVPLSLCLERIAIRDPKSQIPMEQAEIRRVYELGQTVVLPFDLTLENVDLSEAEILQPFAEFGL